MLSDAAVRATSHASSSCSPRCELLGLCTTPRHRHRQWLGTGRARGEAAPRAAPQLVQECSVSDWRSPLRCDDVRSAALGAVIALGKFDAMHVGHRSLAVRAAKMGGHPFLLSFTGMAEVLGWPCCLPLVAPNDRSHVLQSWSDLCGGRCPHQRMIPFREIRHLSPEDFVAVLAKDLQATGVVAGSNYRFGYRARGDAQMLQRLGQQHGLQVSIVDLVGTSGQAAAGVMEQVSSSKIRELLAAGDMGQVQQYLARPYRLVCRWQDNQLPTGAGSPPSGFLISASAFCNQPPKVGVYRAAMSVCSGAGRTCSTSDPLEEALGHCVMVGEASAERSGRRTRQMAGRQLVEVRITGAGLDVDQQLLPLADVTLAGSAMYVVLDFVQC